jgi:hypothetical protein
MSPVKFGARTATLYEAEWIHILATVAENNGNIHRSAQVLGIRRQSLQRKLRKLPPPTMLGCPGCGALGFHRECLRQLAERLANYE